MAALATIGPLEVLKTTLKRVSPYGTPYCVTENFSA
ncbi:hypothetical protein PS838_05969 [Pseudomonas fluorescens]|nr:hypothetical protein PS838_05969 [Pseudomonas fluorescens]